MLHLDDEACKHIDYRRLECECGAKGEMVAHGAYWRDAVVLRACLVRVERVAVDRARCKACGHTHAILPESLVARSKLSVGVCMLIVVALAKRSSSVAELAARVRVAASTVARVANDADRLAALAVGIAWGTACDLATLAEDPTFPARLGEAHGTTPFSRVRVCPAYGPGDARPHSPDGCGPTAGANL